LADHPPETIVLKTLEVLATITVTVDVQDHIGTNSSYSIANVAATELEFPMDESSIEHATKGLRCKSRDREVFTALIKLHADNEWLLADLSNIMTYMCKLQSPEFVMISFAVELHSFIQHTEMSNWNIGAPSPCDLKFISAFVQNMNHVIFNSAEARSLRDVLKDCISCDTDDDDQRALIFQILHHSFSHNIAATVTLCLWVGAYRTAHCVINSIDPLDINLIFLLEIDRLIEMLERPIFR
jgi:Vacuolar protein 14 C-terminal Fig4p binding